MSMPSQAGIGELIPLMYRARWASSSLSGEVRAYGAGDGSGAWEERGSLEVAPDGRYRAEVTDQDGDRDLLAGDDAGGPVPFPELMLPSLLLPGFDFQITGSAEFVGRTGIAIAGTPRLASLQRQERVTALVDAELGILLRYRRVSRDHTDSAEFTALSVIPPEPADPDALVPATVPGGGDRGPGPLAGGHGRVGQSPQDAPAFTDAEVNLLYRSDLRPQRFAASLSEHADTATTMRLARQSFATTELGRRTRWLWRPSDDGALENSDRVARLAVAMPGCYLIEAITDPGRKPIRVTCDGHRLWRTYPDRVAVRAAEPPPRPIATILDPAWLLDDFYQASAAGDAMVDDRPALRVLAAGDALSSPLSPLSGTPVVADQIEAFIDRALGLCLRMVWSYQGHPALRTELTGLTTDIDQAVFSFDPPPGMKIITGGPLAETGLSPATIALQAAKGTAGLAVEIGRRWLNRHDIADPGH